MINDERQWRASCGKVGCMNEVKEIYESKREINQCPWCDSVIEQETKENE